MEQQGMLIRARRRRRSFRYLLWVSISVGAIASALSSGCGNSPTPPNALVYDGMTAPSTVGELLSTLKLIADRRLWDRDDFYAEETLKRLFGSQQIQITTVPEESLSVRLLGFQGLLPAKPGDATQMSGFEFFARKHVKRPALPAIKGASQMFDYKTKRQFQATIAGTSQGLDFNAVTGIFGPGWKENRDAENQLFMAITREPFNPPPPRPTGYMGNTIITYTTGASSDRQEVSLRFDAGGTLRGIDSLILYVDP
jgi:hypothetical protein